MISVECWNCCCCFSVSIITSLLALGSEREGLKSYLKLVAVVEGLVEPTFVRWAEPVLRVGPDLGPQLGGFSYLDP